MYKKVLESIQSGKETLDLYKNDKYDHPVHGRKPHFILSAEKSLYPSKLKLDHEKVLEFLRYKGYKSEEMDGKYGGTERSILVHNPPKHSIKHLKKLASDLGQESSIVSDGHNHEMHYHHGKNAGKHNKGQGTATHKKAPEDFYSTLDDGTHFSHNLDTEKFYKNKDSMHPEKPSKLKKSESSVYRPYLSKAEGSHPLSNPNPNMKLIHYSPQEGLDNIDPNHHGVRKIGREVKQGAPKHKMSFHYLEGVEPESIVTGGSKSKYVSSLGDKKIYDVGIDHLGLKQKASEKAQSDKDTYMKEKGWGGKMMANQEEVQNHFNQMIKDSGHHGIYNSSLGPTMSHAIGMFSNVLPDSEHKLHPKDFKETSSKDHHTLKEHKNHAENFASENGHHSASFLHNLHNKLTEDK